MNFRRSKCRIASIRPELQSSTGLLFSEPFGNIKINESELQVMLAILSYHNIVRVNVPVADGYLIRMKVFDCLQKLF